MVHPGEPSRILVVDDSAPARYALTRVLRKHGFEVIEAASGADALRLGDSENPDLVLLDVNLPDMHGFDVARRMKSGELTRHTPILQLSASATRAEDRVDGLAAGADAYLVQPVEAGELVANIHALLRLRDAQREAETANRLKDEFLATLSHELRTPLNAILGWLQILRRESGNAAKRERAIDVIERNARAQQQIINDILEVSQIVRGQLRLAMERVDLRAVVETAVDSARPTAAAKRQTLVLTLPPAAAVVWADPARIQQMLWNLLSNATKYTPRDGRIDVTVTAGDHDVEIAIRDDGIGIAPEMLPYIFERFRQAHSGPTREYGGLGLGLAIVRHLAEMHGGSVRAASDGVGRGASFTLSLPLMSPPATG